jgi:hypothetical protein
LKWGIKNKRLFLVKAILNLKISLFNLNKAELMNQSIQKLFIEQLNKNKYCLPLINNALFKLISLKNLIKITKNKVNQIK